MKHETANVHSFERENPNLYVDLFRNRSLSTTLSALVGSGTSTSAIT